MKRIALNLFALTFSTIFFTACSTETMNDETSSLNAIASVYEGQDIQQNQMLGTWKIISLSSNVAVDLNGDGKSTTELLNETVCFDSMYFTFNAEGVVEAEQARMSLDNEELKCEGSETYSAAYKVSGNKLSVTANYDGQQVTFRKTIGLSDDEAGEYLHVAVEDYEVEQFISDPGNTVVSNVERIEIVYKKQ